MTVQLSKVKDGGIGEAANLLNGQIIIAWLLTW